MPLFKPPLSQNTFKTTPSYYSSKRNAKAYAWLSGHRKYAGVRGYINFEERGPDSTSLFIECWGLPSKTLLSLELPESEIPYEFTTETGYLRFSCSEIACTLQSLLNNALSIVQIQTGETVSSGLIRKS